MSEKSEKDNKAFQSYIDNIKAKTGKTPADFRALAQKAGLVRPDTKAGEVIAWLEQQITEHGDQTWATLEQAMADQPWHGTACRWVDAAHVDEEQSFEDLLRVTHRLWQTRLEQEVTALIATGQTDRATKDSVLELFNRIKAHQLAARDPLAANHTG